MRSNKNVSTEEFRDAQAGAISASPSHEEIAVNAYGLWVARGDGPGSAEEDWLEAERRLRAEQPSSQQKTSETGIPTRGQRAISAIVS
jgi:hypothetical protein